MDPILEQFLSEARDNLSYLDKHLSELEKGEEETLNALFRAAHTLKGGAGLVGFNAVKEVTHVAEDLFDAYRKGEVKYSEELLDTLYEAFDEVIELIDAAEEIGGVDVDVDEEKIEEIKKDIKSFLTSKDENSGEEKLETSLNIVDEMEVAHLFTDLEVSKLAAQNRILTSPKITNEYLKENHLWIVDIDVDVDTIKLGNDPIYMLYLLGEENVKSVATQVNNCDNLNNDVLEWFTRLVTIVDTNEEVFEDAFYNILDEINLTPFSIEALFNSSYESSENGVLEDFKEEVLSIVKNSDFSFLDEKISAVTKILNPKSKEGFILTRLQSLLSNFKVGSEEYIKVLEIALNKLGITIPKVEVKQVSKENNSNNTSSEVKATEKEINAVVNILQAQLKVIKNAKNDKSLIPRTKLLLSNVLHSIGINDEIENLNDIDSLVNHINSKITQLSGKESEVKQEKQESKKVETNNGVKQSTTIKKTTEEKKVRTKPTLAKVVAKTVKIDQKQIDNLMDIVGELLVMKNALPYIAEHISDNTIEESKREISTKYEEISRATDRLQDIVMDMRLLPLSFIFDRYPKLVRDLSKKLGKKIEYIEEGGETKLDKMMIEKLADPLVHIIRNSLDHGLETEEERIAVGKDPVGKLKISAKPEGDKVIITISDDGRGINLNAVINKAMEKRLVDSDSIDRMSREEKLMLIFHPGLSTKDEITDLSGRGVGTDALKNVIDQLGGKIKVESEEGKGTTTMLELPVSVALTNIFHIKMNNINYAIAMDYIVETQKIQKDELQVANHKPFLQMRGELVPLLFEKKLMGNKEMNEILSIVVIEANNKKFGLIIDEFVGQLDVVQKPLPGSLETHPFISGTSLLGNGDVLFILDPLKLIKQ
jgi:two-component system chemotaxis sensor kinase CheA